MRQAFLYKKHIGFDVSFPYFWMDYKYELLISKDLNRLIIIKFKKICILLL